MKDHNLYVIFGCGMNGKLFYQKMHSRINIVGFSDNNKSLHGTDIPLEDDGALYSLPCLSPLDIDKNCKVIVATAPAYYPEISLQLHNLQLECILVDQFVFEYFSDEVKYVEEKCLIDDTSRKIYCQIIENRKNNNLSAMKLLRSPEQYFAIPEFMNFSGNEIFVDAGSFCGDILDVYITSRYGLFKRIYAFEPGKKQFKALQCRAERLRKEWALDEDQIICVNGAVSNYNGYCSFEMKEHNIATSRIGENKDGDIPVYRLDDYLLDGADFIKADIEGQEMALLRGASKIIQKYQPKLAICLYHTLFDMFEIPIYIKRLIPDYKMEIRHHTYNISETVLYAYI